MSITRRTALIMFSILILTFSACRPLASTSDLSPELTETIEKTATPPPIRPALPTEGALSGTLSIRHSWDENRLPILAGIIKLFQIIHPNVMFDVLYVPAELLRDRFILEASEGLAPDLLLGPSEWGPELFEAGLLADLSAEIDPNLLDTLNPAALQAAYMGKALIGLPYSVSGVLLFRNRDIITIRPDTLNELLTLAQSSTQGATIGSYLETSFFYSGGHLLALGGQLIDQNNLPGFNNGKGVAWLELLQSFRLAGPTNFYGDADLERFMQGEVGWIIDGSWNLRKLAEAIGPNQLAIDPWPSHPTGRLSGFVLAENIYLNAQSSSPDRQAALEFIQFLLKPEAQSLLTEAGAIPAGAIFHPSDPSFGPLIADAATALRGGFPYPTQPEVADYSLVLDRWLKVFFEQNLPPERVLQSAQDEIMNMLAKKPTP